MPRVVQDQLYNFLFTFRTEKDYSGIVFLLLEMYVFFQTSTIYVNSTL